MHGEFIRFSFKEAQESDSGNYFIVARNKHGVDRTFVQVSVKPARHYKVPKPVTPEPEEEEEVVEQVKTEDRKSTKKGKSRK